ncbi:MAG: hypothetical protein HY053_03980 [Proteobacteria bacterium]|nr:hypothetical protein [Pseudomonadota bacterium]
MASKKKAGKETSDSKAGAGHYLTYLELRGRGEITDAYGNSSGRHGVDYRESLENAQKEFAKFIKRSRAKVCSVEAEVFGLKDSMGDPDFGHKHAMKAMLGYSGPRARQRMADLIRNELNVGAYRATRVKCFDVDQKGNMKSITIPFKLGARI